MIRERDVLEGELEERVRAALEVDHAQPVLERLRRVVVGETSGDLVRGQEAEPDRDLQHEVRVAARQVPSSHSHHGRHLRIPPIFMPKRPRPRGDSPGILSPDVGHLDPRRPGCRGGADLRVTIGADGPQLRDACL